MRHRGSWPDVIIASTTSTILVDDLSGAIEHPERFLNVHWLNPAYLIPLVEISPGKRPTRRSSTRVKALLEGIGKVPVVCAATPGYIIPRIQALAMNEAARMVEEGVASAEDIDKAIRYGFGFRYAVLGCSNSSTGAAATSSITPAAISKARSAAIVTARPTSSRATCARAGSACGPAPASSTIHGARYRQNIANSG